MAKGSYAECPKCGAKVRRQKLRRHISNVHGEGPRTRKAAKRVSSPKVPVRFPWHILVVLAVAGIIVFAVFWFVVRPSSEGTGPPSTALPVAVIVVRNFGTMEVELDTVRAPITAGNFIDLANRGFYDGLTFHRVVPGFVIQGGDPNGDGTGGSGTTISWEDTGLKNRKYTIAMARGASPDSASSQFYINLADNPNLDNPPAYVVFGRVIAGFGVVDAIGPVPTDPSNDRPLDPPVLGSVTIR